MVHFTVSLPPSTNSVYATNFRTGRRFMAKSGKDWKTTELPRIVGLLSGFNIEPPLFITYRIYFRDRRKRDIGNFLKVLEDTIFSVIGFDDCWEVYRGYTVVCMGIDKENPRIEVSIQRYEVDFC